MLHFTVNITSRNIDLDVSKLLQRAGRYMVSSTVDKIQNMTSPPNSALTVAIKGGGKAKPLRDTGQLMSSIHYTMRDSSTVVVGTNRTGARIQNEGGTIRPKKAKYLWIPADNWARSQLRRNGWSITQTIRTLKGSGYCYRKGRLFVYRQKGSKEEKKLFILRDSVHIPQRRFFFISEDDEKEIRRILRSVIEK